MLWVLKRTVSRRRFFRAPKAYVVTDGLENNRNFTQTFLAKLALCIGVKTYLFLIEGDIEYD